MKKIIYLLVSLVLLAIHGWAAPVDESAARTIVQDFVIEKRNIYPNSVPTSGGSDLQLLHAEMSSVSVTMNAYYIYNTGDGFVIVAGDDRAERILGYGDEELDLNEIPCCMQFMLDSYKEQIDYLLEHPGLEVETPSMNAPMLTATNVAPMVTAKFNQGKPYNNLVPTYNGSRCRAGCSCVALCQVMHYYKYPTIDVPKVPAYTTRTHDIYMPELPSDRFHWNYIKDSYKGSYTADEAYSVAKLMKYAGQAMEMDYSPDGSGAAVFQIRDAAVLFGYDHNAEVLYKEDNYTDAQWAALIQAELRADRPVVYAGWSTSTGSLVGHAFVIDGFNATQNKYHINWGWGGSGNNYFALNAFNVSNYQFNHMQQMIFGLKPQSPEIVVEPKPLYYGNDVGPTSISFNTVAGETIRAYIIVNGYALTGDLTVTLNNGGNVYSIETYTITREEAVKGTNVIVNYKPTEVGTSNASVTISGGGAEPKTVSLKGTASAATTITTSPSSLSFNAYVGETKTETFTVKCPNAISNLKLTLNNGGSIYSIDKTSISKSAANSGVNVTVTYKPTEAGTSNASVTISGGGAEPKTVSLSGTAINKPEITTNPASLSFNTYVGMTKTDTVTVKCPYAKSDLVLELNNGGTIYSIDKTRISKSDAINGTTIAVTYSPTEVGLSNASVTISGGGAEAKTVTLSGTAEALITVHPPHIMFYSYVGESKSETITVTAPDVTEDIVVKFDDHGGTYSIDKSIISVEEAVQGTTVTVTYKPTREGKLDTHLRFESSGARTATAHVEGKAYEKPLITVDSESLSFNCYTNQQASQTFTVRSDNLLSSLSLTLNDTTGFYSLDKTTITNAEASNGATVTVTYHPTADGSHNASVTITGGGAEAKTVTLEGCAVTPGIPEITTDVSAVTFESTYTGYQSSRTIIITCPYLLNDLQLNLVRDNTNSFGLSKQTITPEEAAAGAEVTVYFSPTTGGGKHATLSIKSDGVETVSIPINGTGIKSDGYITAWPTNLSFDTQVGTPVTQTFKVTYTSANGGGVVMISSVGSGGDMAFDSEGSNESVPPTFNAFSNLSDLTRTKIPFDSIIWRKVIIDSLPLVLVKSLVLELTGDDCFDVTPKRIRLSSIPSSTYVTVTYNPECIGEHDGNIKIWLFGGSARPFILPLHGTATAQFNYDNDGNDLMITQSVSSINTIVNEMLMNIKVYADGLNIIIDCPEEENAIISDIAGHVREANLQAGRNEIPINASGIYIVRIREKTTKLMLK